MLKNLGENGRLGEDKELEGKRTSFVKNRGQPLALKSAESLGVVLGKGVGTVVPEQVKVALADIWIYGYVPKRSYRLRLC